MHAHLSRWLILGSWLMASVALAQPVESPAPGEPVAQGVSIGISDFRHLGMQRPSEEVMNLEAAYLRALGTSGLRRHLYVGGGLRFALPTGKTTFPLEAFARTELRARLGWWEPGMGFELGYSRVALPWQRVRLPFATEWFGNDDALTGPFYAAIHAAPLRFHFGRFVVGGPEVQWGPAGPPFGSVQRLQIGLARVEMQL